MTMRMLSLALFAWVLWVDQTQYQLADGGPGAPIVAETARGRWQTLAVTDNRGQCEQMKQAAIRDATAREGTTPGIYRAEHRYFCSPAEGLPGR